MELPDPKVARRALLRGQVEELGRYQAVGRRGWNPLGEVRVQPSDALRHIGADLDGVGGAACQGDRGQVHRRDLPAPLGQPEGVCTFPATDSSAAPAGRLTTSVTSWV